LHQEALAARKLADVQEAMERQVHVTTNNNPAEFAALIRNETAVWADVIKTAGIKAE
jgi:tripartite-type tricarboxylate transporter receptor subunit TctC